MMSLLRSIATILLLRSVGAVLAHAAMTAALVMLWRDPMVFGPGVAGDLEFLLLMEFLVLHSTAFLVACRFMKGFPSWVFIVLYAPFALMIGASMSSWLVTVLFFWHLASGVWGDFDTAERNVGSFLARYVPTFLWFMALPYAVVLLRVPTLGWEQYPSLAFTADDGFRSLALIPAWTTIYFAGRTLWEIAVRHWERTGQLQRFLTAVQKT
jgi:hypothetical protein